MTELGILLSDMAVCVACRDVVDDTVETPEGVMCRRCAEECDHPPLEFEMRDYVSMYMGDEEVER